MITASATFAFPSRPIFLFLLWRNPRGFSVKECSVLYVQTLSIGGVLDGNRAIAGLFMRTL